MSSKLIRNDIQGLRAISVISVIIFHAWQSLLPGGFVGVDMFFVISGFVITTTILKDLDSGGFTIGQFYRRRVRRIFPALYLVLFVTAVVSFFVLSPKHLVDFEKSSLATVFFSSNIYFLKSSGYFDGAASLKPLLHTWSLSVEEQFYFVYPLALVFLYKYPRLLIPALLGLAGVSLLVSQSMLGEHPSAVFYLAPSRAFELLIGAVLACPLLRPLPERLRNAASLAGLAMVGAALFLINEQVPFPGVTALLPCLGVGLIIYAGNSGPTQAGRMLSIWPLVLIGNLSYSLYLWHWPALALARNFFGGELGSYLSVMVLLLAVLASVISFKYVEQPLLRKRWSKLPYLRIAAVTMVVFPLLAIPGVLSHGFPQRFSPASLALFSASEDFNQRRTDCHGDHATPIPYKNNCIFGVQGGLPDVAVWGDSHGAELVVPMGERLNREGRAVMQITASACPPALNYKVKDRPRCQEHNHHIVAQLVADPRIKTVVLAANFTGYRHNEFATMLSGYQQVVSRLRSGGKRVVLVAPIPVFDFDPPALLGIRNEWRQLTLDIGLPTQVYRAQNAQVFQFLSHLNAPDRDLVLPQRVLCDAELCRSYSADHGVLYFNSNHLSLMGAKVLVDAMHL
jgi:peptidoglycan/LPS O-acetylase OafA/YrhL